MSQDSITQALANDRPVIDAAIKSFVSLFAARALSTGDTEHGTTFAVTQARALLKAINNYTFPLLPDPSEEYRVISQIWNGLIASKQKPSRFLGRTALLQMWQHGLPDEIENGNALFINEFGTLLTTYDRSPTQESDACLIWDEDKGQAELNRRKQRRADRAREAEEEADRTPRIEELPDEEEKKEAIEESVIQDEN